MLFDFQAKVPNSLIYRAPIKSFIPLMHMSTSEDELTRLLSGVGYR
jgi:hypothetical protein